MIAIGEIRVITERSRSRVAQTQFHIYLPSLVISSADFHGQFVFIEFPPVFLLQKAVGHRQGAFRRHRHAAARTTSARLKFAVMEHIDD